MEKQQKKQIRKYIAWILLAAVVGLLAAMPMLAAGETPASGPQASALTAQAELRDISAKIMGGGTLTSQDALEITIPAAVKLTEYLVSNGDIVAEGQEIAAVDRVTVMTAITQVQETLTYLAEQISEVRDEEAPDEVYATAGGTVKCLYGEVGDQVSDVILEHGALAVLSLDGLMAVEINRNTSLSGGDAVNVILSDGSEAQGRVESNLEGVLIITVEDQDYTVGDKVTVETMDGDRLGSGTLYIHSQWNVVAYTGSISRVSVREGQTVSAGTTLFRLEDTGTVAEFESLTRQHREYEALMLELFRMYQSQRITAPGAGMVTGVEESGAYMLSAESGWKVSLLANAPDGNDESIYVNYVGQVAQVGIDGLVLKMNPQPLAVTDYKDLSAVPMDPALMTEDAVYTAGAPVYELVGEEWVQIDASAITAGDVLLFAGDESGSFVWVVRVAKGAVSPEEPSEPTEPSEPIEPEDPSEPSEPEDPATPAVPSQSGSSQSGTSMPGMSSGALPEESVSLYGLDTVTIATVIPQDTMTVQITVDEQDISAVYVGQNAQVTVNALPGRMFTAEVTQVSNSGENQGGSSKFTVELTLEMQQDMLAGMNASVSITKETLESVLCVPVAALVESGAQTRLYTSYDEETGEYGGAISITTGVSDGEYVQILSGIGEGQTICYPYYDTLEISNTPESGGFPFG